jgi:hypothetical protein
MTTRAEAYVTLALWGIKLSRSANGLRVWWAEEAGHRDDYELSQEQIDILADACRDHIRDLGEIAKEKPEQPAPKRRSKPKQLPLI